MDACMGGVGVLVIAPQKQVAQEKHTWVLDQARSGHGVSRLVQHRRISFVLCQAEGEGDEILPSIN
jgi:hypothetical protein